MICRLILSLSKDDRSSLTRWRQRLGEEHLTALLQESLAVAYQTGALATKDLERVAVDTTVQPKAVAYPTDARLMHRALIKLVDLARRCGVRLRQSYRRVAKHALIRIGRGIVNLARSQHSWRRHSHHVGPNQPTRAVPVASRHVAKARSRAARYSLADRR